MAKKIKYSKLKLEILDLFGTLSIEEIIGNLQVRNLIEDIGKSLTEISMVEYWHSTHNKGQ